MYCGKKKKKRKKKLFVNCSVTSGWKMRSKIYFTCVTSYNVTRYFFVTVINQKSALVIWGMKEILCSMY